MRKTSLISDYKLPDNLTYLFPAFVKEYKGCTSQLYQDQ